ncbi:MAG TPA: amino acid ABC transporter permease, partial [Anaeromyxobacteraceae bacterium]|nr:amino acid ABC transporter permease [Anaeromyxobacteraceae bacterium]
RPPPVRERGLVGWVRRELFAGPASAAATLAVLVLAAVVLPRAWRWLVAGAVWRPDYDACRALEYRAACWGMVAEKHRLVLFGRYPWEEQWRPLAATLLVVAALLASAHPRAWRRWLLPLWAGVLAAFLVLLRGGVLGLAPVEPGTWGGLPITVLLTLVGIGASIPLGVALALGRRSRMPLVRGAATLYVQLVRGVPLITVLFVATFVFPLVLPRWLTLDALGRVLLGITLFQAAYMAEVVRGGLQGLPAGQAEAAASLGLSWWQMQRKVILPQALVIVIPSFMNSVLSTFMDTSLVTVVSMYDLTGALRLALGDPQWRNFFIEGYLFVGAIYLCGCLALSRYGHWLEGRLGRWRRREVGA